MALLGSVATRQQTTEQHPRLGLRNPTRQGTNGHQPDLSTLARFRIEYAAQLLEGLGCAGSAQPFHTAHLVALARGKHQAFRDTQTKPLLELPARRRPGGRRGVCRSALERRQDDAEKPGDRRRFHGTGDGSLGGESVEPAGPLAS